MNQDMKCTYVGGSDTPNYENVSSGNNEYGKQVTI